MCRFALKTFKNNSLIDDAVRKATHEMTKLQALNHENIIKFVEFFTENNSNYIVSEYCQGGDLSELIKIYSIENKRVTDEDAFEWSNQMMKGLDHLHSQNIVHRNIKPA